MTMLAALVVAGYVLGLPVLTWHRQDLLSFHRPLWAGYGSRQARLQGALICYAAGGWPELFMALGWRTSQVRSALVAERETMRENAERRPPPEP